MPRTDYPAEPLSTQFRVMLSPRLHEALREHAEANERTMAVEARRAIEAHIERERAVRGAGAANA